MALAAGPSERAGSQEPSDLELLRGIAAGDESSFRVFFRRWAPRLGRFLWHATRSPEVAEDLLQETFLRVLRAAPRFTPHGPVGAWVYRIAANLAYSHWRRMRGTTALQPLEPAARETPAPAAFSPELTRVRRAWAQDAREAVEHLPENHRLVFLLKVDQALTYEEIGEVLACPTGTAKSRFHHAVRRLRTALSQWEHLQLDEPSHPAARPGRDAHVV